MKRFFTVAIVSVIIFGFCYSNTQAASFEDLKDGKDNYIIEQIAGDVYIKADSKITIKDDVPGDVFAIGREVVIEGNVEKNVYAAARTVDIRGNVEGSLYMAGGNLTTNGDVKGDLYAAGVNVRISGDIGGDLDVIGARVKVEGEVTDDARLSGLVVVVDNDVNGDLIVRAPISSVNGNVGNDLVNTGGTLNFESGNLVGSILNFDNANTNLSEEVEQDKTLTDNARELENNEQQDVQMAQDEVQYRDTLKNIGKSILWVIIESIGFIILGIFILRFAPVKVNSSLWMMENLPETGKSFGVGFVALPAIFIIGLLLGITIIGIPLLLFLFGTFLAVSMMCIPLVGLRFGRALVNLTSIKDKYYLSLIVGIVAIEILLAVPYIGAVVGIIVYMLGVGTMIRMQFTKFVRARKYI